MQQRGHGSAGAHPQVQEPPDSLYQHVGYGSVPGYSPMHGHHYPSSSPISQGVSRSFCSSWCHSLLHRCSNKCKQASPFSISHPFWATLTHRRVGCLSHYCMGPGPYSSLAFLPLGISNLCALHIAGYRHDLGTGQDMYGLSTDPYDLHPEPYSRGVHGHATGEPSARLEDPKQQPQGFMGWQQPPAAHLYPSAGKAPLRISGAIAAGQLISHAW